MTTIETKLVQGANRTEDDRTGAISPSLNFSTAFRHPGLGESTGFDYARVSAPTRALLEKQLAQLESGQKAYAVSSGMSAIQLVFQTLLQTGDHFITSDDLYGGSFRYFDQLRDHYQIAYDTWNGVDVNELILKITPKTKLIWLETPSNPTMKLIDIQAVVTAVKAVRDDLLIAVDNTFLTPIYQQPLDAGADIVVHSATKYLGGHNDILAGVVVLKDAQYISAFDDALTTTGQVLDPFDSWLLIRSLKTLHVRMKTHTVNAQAVAKILTDLPGVDQVLYPGIGGMISFYLNEAYSVDEFLRHLTVFSFAESLGGVESLITVPAVQTHHDMTAAQREALGITDQLIRVSVGLENAADLIDDLKQAIAASHSE